jgi:membrane glycosyltransferase
MAALVGGTVTAVVFWMGHLLGADGFSASGLVMLILFALTTPYLVLAFWNSAIGFLLLKFGRNPLAALVPGYAGAKLDEPVKSDVAIVIPVRNESPDEVFDRLQALLQSLDAGPDAHAFDIFVLSDTLDPTRARIEEQAFEALKASDPTPDRLIYRRRTNNEAFKSGNIWDFCNRFGDRYDYMVVMDSDSVMAPETIRTLVKTMEASPRLGILQPLIVGLPSVSPFARIFQFGMRHGMRVYAAGSAWWQGDEGPYWGHNAVIRLAAFRRHCRMPKLPEERFLGGHILSHDQVEAVLMRRGGYEVRVLPIEHGSYEDNPPTLADFLKRDLRWCQGNMQYVHLLNLPGARPIGRLQLFLAMLMYLGAPFWMGFLAIGMAHAFTGTPLIAPSATLLEGVGLFAVMMFMAFAPKLIGLIDALSRAEVRRAFGGAGPLLRGAALETGFGVLLGPVMSLTHAAFIIGLLLGRKVHWTAQIRDPRTLSWGEALRGFWLHMTVGIAATAGLALTAPGVLPWAAPLLLSLSLAVPFAKLTTHAGLGHWLARGRWCATPEEIGRQGMLRNLGVPWQTPVSHPVPIPRAKPAPATTS